MPKYYIALIDRPDGKMHVPVKAQLNPYNKQRAYCAGMPQFFGGTDDRDTPPAAVLAMEVTQESRGTLELIPSAPHYFADEGNMFFYYATEGEWARTGAEWEPASTPEQAEMDRLVEINLFSFRDDMDDQAIVGELMVQAGCELGTEGGEEFEQSATKAAFIALIRKYLADDL